jgi:phosphoglycerol transferase MdoB-like AlkP superfamily enzyme
MTELYSESPLVVKGIIKLTILLKNQLDFTMFLAQMLKLSANPLYKADIQPFLDVFTGEKYPYNESIHEIMKSILNSQTDDKDKVPCVLFINKYEISEDDEEFYGEVKSMMDRLGKTGDQELKEAVKQAVLVLKVEEN